VYFGALKRHWLSIQIVVIPDVSERERPLFCRPAPSEQFDAHTCYLYCLQRRENEKKSLPLDVSFTLFVLNVRCLRSSPSEWWRIRNPPHFDHRAGFTRRSSRATPPSCSSSRTCARPNPATTAARASTLTTSKWPPKCKCPPSVRATKSTFYILRIGTNSIHHRFIPLEEITEFA